jgi:predicted GNAT family acetyltransferase
VEIEIVNVPDKNRYEARLSGRVAGFSAYQIRRGPVETTVFTHTEVSPEFEGRGIGSALARGALDAVRVNGGNVLALCPFVARFIRDHEEYQDLLTK